MIFDIITFLIGGCIGWGIALFIAGAFGVDESYNNKGAEDEY